MTKADILQYLQLQPHMEGGYFRRTYCNENTATLADGATRAWMSSIFYLLTDDSPIGYFHRNRSDILHFWQGGASLTYYLIAADGCYRETVLGPNLAAGEQLQLLVSGNTWKATRLNGGEFGLLSEAVTPGFDYSDMQLASAGQLRAAYPDLWRQRGTSLASLCKP